MDGFVRVQRTRQKFRRYAHKKFADPSAFGAPAIPDAI